MEADWSILQRQTITDHLMEVVVVAVFSGFFFAPVFIIVSHFLSENLAKEPIHA